MPRPHGYAQKGERCYGLLNWGAKGRTNAIGAQIGKILLTLSLFACSINTDVFHSWVIKDRIPKLPQKAIIVMDNAAFHKAGKTQKVIKNAGHILEYLPPYSPDLNPIEHKWAQAKAIRKQKYCSIEEIFTQHHI